MMRAYNLQCLLEGQYAPMRMSDGQVLWREADILDELNRLAFENKELRAEQDDRTKRLQSLVERLTNQVERLESEAKGQTKMVWPGMQY